MSFFCVVGGDVVVLLLGLSRVILNRLESIRALQFVDGLCVA